MSILVNSRPWYPGSQTGGFRAALQNCGTRSSDLFLAVSVKCCQPRLPSESKPYLLRLEHSLTSRVRVRARVRGLLGKEKLAFMTRRKG